MGAMLNWRAAHGHGVLPLLLLIAGAVLGVVMPWPAEAAFPWEITRPPVNDPDTGTVSNPELTCLTDPTIVYPPGAVKYVRKSQPPISVPFFSSAWYVGFVLMFLSVAVLFSSFFFCFHVHFKQRDQEEAKKIVQQHYETYGFFDLAAVNAPPEQEMGMYN